MGPLDVGWWTDPDTDDQDNGRRRMRRGRGQRNLPEAAVHLPHPGERSSPRKEAGLDKPGLGNASLDRSSLDKPSLRDPVKPLAAAGVHVAHTGEQPAIVKKPSVPLAEETGSARHPPRTRADHVRTVVRGFGQTLITLGLVVLLFVVYELWVTDLFNHSTQHRLGTALRKQWESGDDPLVNGNSGRPRRPGEKVARIPLGRGIANIYIPAFGPDYVFTIVEGTDPSELEEGPGHYPDSQLPGQPGNFAVAGHRVGKGSPFLNLDKLRAGSAIVIETKDNWYTYRVMGDRRTGDPTQPGNGGVRGMQIVDPSDVAVIDVVPDQPGAPPHMHLLTLTTCNPKFSARERLIIHAQQEGGPLSKSRGVLPPALRG